MSLLDTASLIVTPNGYKEGKLYSVIPSDGSGDLSVVRATTAIRVNSAGLVELVPYNLLQYSQDATNAVWGSATLNGTLTRTANYGTAPDGTTTADRLQMNLTGTGYVDITQNVSVPSGQTYTYSVYLKSLSGTPTFCYLNDGVSGNKVATLTTDWQRYTFTINSSGTFIYPRFLIETGQTSTSADVLVWGAQLVEGSTAKDYQKTETRLNIPRLDYSNGTCPSLLVEPQRTNLALYSSSFDNAAWFKENTTTTANSVASPSGIQDADTLTTTSTTLENFIRFGTFSILGNVGSSYTTSVYVKKGSANYLRIRNLFVNNGANAGNAWFDLTNGTLGTIESSQTASIEDAGNGWWRCSLTGVVGSSNNFNFIDFGLSNTDNIYYSSSIVNSYIWGAQLEAGSYATSYIPTTSASVTRNADVISKTGISSLIGQTEGTVYADFVATGSGTHEILGVTLTGGGSEYIALFSTSNGNLYFASNVLGLVLIDTNSYNKRYKIAYSFESGSHILYSNGNVITTSTSGSVYSLLNAVYLGSSAVGSGIELLEANAVALWKTRLTNTQLAQLTTI